MPKRSDWFFTCLAWLSGTGILLTVAILVVFLLLRGIGSINASLFFGETPWFDAITGRKPVFDGIWPAVAGTFSLVALSSLLSIPVGIASGVYLSGYAPKRLRVFLGFAIDLLSGTPSIVMGLFGFTLILFLRKTIFPEAGTCLFLASLCIALLVLPYVIRTTETSLDAVPEHLRVLGPAMGLTKSQSIRHVLLPLASRGILSGVILSIGRASEDTAVILLTGVVAQAGVPQSLWGKFEALPFRIYYLAAEHKTPLELEQAFGTALVLLTLTGVLFLTAVFVQRSAEKRWKKK
ncbi:PstA family ABC transporter permease [Desulforhabdus amnigena]|jgi:phosphate transport system permease protein|uniref:Phosphate ABC transporter permease n=1 Tax=Desulforhabdus amnigena TaxID=40218 RepID=A0A9W6D1L1_9BACT|nr:ABC transporter permease subunit [Desulforhabdus amnigena]NLJ29102.1 ABC transporter permease subunit [Deltaproteobacteria bacterium]GLI32577.1 phosphate ABC transporter permease [Desulforhabdus amnigena]